MPIEVKMPHRWDVAPYEAQHLQRELAAKVDATDASAATLTAIAGVEVAHSRFSDTLTVSVAVTRYPEMTLLERVTVEHRTRFPYIPGLLSFREVPAILEALGQLTVPFDALMVDGPGVAHPQGLGVASHLGVVLDLPTIGCARTNLIGSYVEPEVSAGSQTSLVFQGEIVGMVYRSKNRTAPLFVSAGHRLSRQRAFEIVTACCAGYRLPEPTRHAYAGLAEAKEKPQAAV